MKTYVYYGLGGVAIAIAAAALIKRKPKFRRDDTMMLVGPGKALSGPRVYVSATGDNPRSIAARFGIKSQSLMSRGNKYFLPAGLADMGPRAGAQGIVR